LIVCLGGCRFAYGLSPEVAPTGGRAQRITGEFVLIAVGSEPFRPADIPFDDPDIDDSDTILAMDRLPERLAIMGGGVIGCEYACMFAALGTRVTLIDGRADILPFLDREMIDRLRTAMEGLGIELRLGASYASCQRVDDKTIRTTLKDGSIIDADKFLFAAGRSGRTADLGLENVALKPDKRGNVAVNEHYQTSVPNIYAVGDVIGFPALASTSMEQARVAAVHAFHLGYKQAVGALLPYGIYTIPEVSFVGVTEEEAKQKGMDVVAGRAFFRDNARGKITGEREGLVKLLFERSSRKLVGIHCLGERATELVHIGLAIMTLGGGIDALIEMVFNYPTLAESYKYAAYDALGKLKSS
jgi:NAD(P) transhydrogenase